MSNCTQAAASALPPAAAEAGLVSFCKKTLSGVRGHRQPREAGQRTESEFRCECQYQEHRPGERTHKWRLALTCLWSQCSGDQGAQGGSWEHRLRDSDYSDISEHQHHTAMAPSPQVGRASSLGPILGIPKKLSFRDNGLYECNYESIDSWSSGSNENDAFSNSAIKRLESSVKSVDSIIGKPKHYESLASDRGNKIHYDSITVVPLAPPPPLPRTRSFRQPRARTALPLPGPGLCGGRARSAPPIPPLTREARQRRDHERWGPTYCRWSKIPIIPNIGVKSIFPPLLFCAAQYVCVSVPLKLFDQRSARLFQAPLCMSHVSISAIQSRNPGIVPRPRHATLHHSFQNTSLSNIQQEFCSTTKRLIPF